MKVLVVYATLTKKKKTLQFPVSHSSYLMCYQAEFIMEEGIAIDKARLQRAEHIPEMYVASLDPSKTSLEQ